MKIKETRSEKIGRTVIVILLLMFALSTTYPFWHVLMYSISDSKKAMTGGLFFWPKGFSLESYKMLFKTSAVFTAYRNTILKTLIGTSLSLILSALTAFPLSVRRLPGRKVIAFFIFFTMLFSGGMIPTFLVVNALGLVDTFWALILPNAIKAYNMFILRNAFLQLPPSIEESAYIDGATPPVALFRIIMPMTAPTIAALAIFYGISNWNSYLDCILYTNSDKLQVLQVYLRNLISSAGSMDAIAGVAGAAKTVLTEESMKMTTIAVSIIPILIVYPWLQKFYTKGLTVGAVKE